MPRRRLATWRVDRARRPPAGQVDLVRVREVELGLLDVARDVDEHGAAAAGRATWKAAFITCGSSSTSCTSHECLTIGIVMPVMSHSWKASVPIRCERTWPVMQTSGVESIHASAIGVTRFVAPGPEVANATPTRPDARA